MSKEKPPAPKFRPLADRILVRVDAAETVTRGGIHLPDKAQEKPHKGVVLAVGPGSFKDGEGLVPVAVRPGDTVYFSAWAGTELPAALGDGLRVMSETDLFGVEE